MQVYSAVIVAHLIYGLNTVHLTPALLNKIDAFQIRGSRYVLEIEHAYDSSIEFQKIEVYGKISIIQHKGTNLDITWQVFISANHFENPKQVKKLSEYIMTQQSETMVPVIRADWQDPMRQHTIINELHIPGVHMKRVGRPRVPTLGSRELHVAVRARVSNENHKAWIIKQAIDRVM